MLTYPKHSFAATASKSHNNKSTVAKRQSGLWKIEILVAIMFGDSAI
jgi:hypothetical protein